jgi:hypothetical protein
MSVVIGFISFVVFLCFQARGIYGGDSGDLVTASVTGGVPHPPGYPLYTFIGWLVTRLPILTPAWRIGFLSNVSHVVTLGFIYKIVYSLTRNKRAALFACLTLLGNYLFFLYSVTPEVFALLDLFVVVLSYCVLRFIQTKQARYLSIGAFVFGLSLSHHQMILFLIPAIVLVLWRMRRIIKQYIHDFRFTVKLMGFVCLGLFAYIYIPFAAHGNSVINWDHAVNVTNFIRLITRDDYGTFVTGSPIGPEIIHRVLNMKVYIYYIMIDFSFFGILLILLGGYQTLRKNRSFGLYIILAIILLGPLFLFYASFPILSRFSLGTYERFLLPSYVLLSVIVGMGYTAVIDLAERFSLKMHVRKKFRSLLVITVSLIIFIYPLAFIGISLWRFWGLPNDSTGNNLGRDILASVPKHSLLLLTNDTPLFTTQYIRYALLERTDVAVVHVNLLSFHDYRAILSQRFPDLYIPNVKDDVFTEEFIRKNVITHQVFTNIQLHAPQGWSWIPHGLVYQLYSNDALPDKTIMREFNVALWNQYHDPTKQILSRYNHLMLSDVLNVYAGARLNFGKVLFQLGELDNAKTQFRGVLDLKSDTQLADAYTYLGLSELFQKHCDEALSAFTHAKQQVNADIHVTQFESVTYRDCVGNTKKAKELQEEYLKAVKTVQTPLHKL